MLQNNVQLIGNVGAEIELKGTNENNVVNFSLATDESYTNSQGQKVEKTVWYRIVAWGKTAQILSEHTKKGSKLLVKGKLTYNKYTKEKDGVKFDIQTTEIQVNEFLFLGNPKK